MKTKFRDEDRIWGTLKDWFKEASTDLSRKGIPEDGKEILLFLGASRCAEFAPGKEPTIVNIADLSVLNRNSVAEMAKVLRPIGLVNKRQKGRGEVILPTKLGDLYSDIFLNKSKLPISYLKRMENGLLKGALPAESIEEIEVVESAIDFVKKSYPENTLNYEIYDALHHRVIDLIAASRNHNHKRASTLLRETAEALELIEEESQRAEKRGLKPLILQLSGDDVGRGRVYRPAQNK